MSCIKNESDIFDNLIRFIEEIRYEPIGIDRGTRLEEDLGLYGDDAVEFLFAFSKKFDVDISTFKFTDYFFSEGGIICQSIINFITNKKKKSLTIADLEEAIKSKVLK
ncbi:DUF1493 family protein [Odoribacter sp. OttesenSCG-928-G04]|nr:DUF1493 family protein [Odoribacter sp. OttesenSCG-928-G04]